MDRVHDRGQARPRIGQDRAQDDCQGIPAAAQAGVRARLCGGLPSEERSKRLRSVAEATRDYLKGYSVNHRPKSVQWSTERIAHVERLLGEVLLPDLTEPRIRDYMERRQTEAVSGRTINMELVNLSLAIGHPWRELWPNVRKLEERHDIGVALSEEDEAKLLLAADGNKSPTIATFIRVALLTGLRSGEIRDLQWGRIDLGQRTLIVGKSKTHGGAGRVIPMSDELFDVLKDHANWFTGRFGETRPEYFLFPFSHRWQADPTRPTLSVKKAWGSVRKEAAVRCRFHDLRHTALTKMAEAGVPESVMMALAGHLSRAMLERYSHVRMKAKREAVETMRTARPKHVSNEVPTESPTIAPGEIVQW